MNVTETGNGRGRGAGLGRRYYRAPLTLAVATMAISLSAISWFGSARVPQRSVPMQTAPETNTSRGTKSPAASPQGKPGDRNGLTTGVRVHGHWRIVVRNPNGTVVRRVEFENSLDPGVTFLKTQLPGGAALLGDVMAGQAVTPPGSWTIILAGPAGLGGISSDSNGPCSFSSESLGTPFGGCIIAGSNSALAELCSTSGQPPSPVASCNLSAAPVPSGFQLSGNIFASNTGQIAAVATLAGAACGTSSAPLSNCALTNAGGMDTLTSTSSFPGAPINVTTGQSLSVTVTITFSSGS